MRTLAAIISLVLLGGCGQTGPLYLPGEEPPGRSNTRDGSTSGTAAQPVTVEPGQTPDTSAD